MWESDEEKHQRHFWMPATHHSEIVSLGHLALSAFKQQASSIIPILPLHCPYCSCTYCILRKCWILRTCTTKQIKRINEAKSSCSCKHRVKSMYITYFIYFVVASCRCTQCKLNCCYYIIPSTTFQHFLFNTVSMLLLSAEEHECIKKNHNEHLP